MNVSICQSNLEQHFSEDTFSLLGEVLNQPGVETEEYLCQSHCKVCKTSPYAIVNGEMIVGETGEDLLEKIKSARAQKNE